MSTRPPDWQLPAGVTPGLWEYLHDPQLAAEYLGKVSDSPFAQADLRFVAKHLLQPGLVIDLGCGPGRNLLPLAERGFACTGVDLSPHMLQEAQARFTAEGCTATWLTANVAEPLPVESHQYDAALCLFGTLGMLQPSAAREALLREVARILKPNGIFLLHVHNRWAIQGWRTLFSKQDVVTMPVHQGISRLQMKLYTERELRQQLHHTGFDVMDWQYLSTRPNGDYQGTHFLGPFRAAGFLVAARPFLQYPRSATP
jgi:SAM-dependent methyltransferase